MRDCARPAMQEDNTKHARTTACVGENGFCVVIPTFSLMNVKAERLTFAQRPRTRACVAAAVHAFGRLLVTIVGHSNQERLSCYKKFKDQPVGYWEELVWESSSGIGLRPAMQGPPSAGGVFVYH